MVVNAGQNYVEAINFCMPEWDRALVPKDECFCKKSGYPAAQELFNRNGRQECCGKGAAGKRRINYAISRGDDLNTGKCSGLSIGLAFTIVISWFFLFIPLGDVDALLVNGGVSSSDAPSGTDNNFAKPNGTSDKMVDTHDLGGVEPEAGKLQCGPEFVNLLESDSAEESSFADDAIDRGCRGVIFGAFDTLLLEPGQKLNDT